MDAPLFFDTVYGGQQGNVFICSLDDNRQLTESRKFNWPLDKRKIRKYTAGFADYDLYFSVCVFTGNRRTRDDEGATSKVVWVDADTCAPENFKIQPSITVQTSPGRYHCMWVLDKVYPASECSLASKAIAYEHKDQGCDHGYQVSKILRVPGTANTKNEPYTVEVIESTGEVYSLNDIHAQYPADDPQSVPAGIPSMPDPWPKDSQALLRAEQRLEERNLIDEYTAAHKKGTSWSETAWRFYNACFRAGLDEQDVFQLALHYRGNKYHPDNVGKLTEQGVPIPARSNWEACTYSEVVRCAAASTDIPLFVNATSVDDAIGDSEGSKYVSDLLSYADRKADSNYECFVDYYVDIVRRYTDAYPRYHEVLSIQVLSAAFGAQLRSTVPAYRSIPLNAWVMICGQSSVSRKTTAVRLCRDAIDMFDEIAYGDEYRTYLGGDTTPEALNKALSGRPNKVSLVYFDEVHGFLKSSSKREHMMNMKPVAMKLYNGHTEAALRMDESRRAENVPVCYNMIGSGVDGEVANALTTDDFSNGFMLRHLLVVRPDMENDNIDSNIYYPENMPEGEARKVLNADDEMERHLLVLVARRSELFAGLGEGEYVRVSATKEAEELMNAVHSRVRESFTTLRSAEEHKDLDGASERIREQYVKIAGLLAAADPGVPVEDQMIRIEARHVRRAVKIIEPCLADTVTLYRMASKTDHARLCDAVKQTLIEKGGKRKPVKSEVIYSAFSNFEYWYIEKCLMSLSLRGSIRIIKDRTGEKSYKVVF